MHGKRPKKQSKRMTLRKKYKIIRKVKEHHKKVKKDKRKHPEKYAKKKKDPGVPNSHPFKAQIVAEAQEAIRLEQERREKMKQELSLRRKEDRENAINQRRSINNFLEDVESRRKDFELKNKVEATNSEKFSDKSAKAYYKEFRKVVEASDVVLEVLDARDPLGSRCTPMEEYVISKEGKKLVLVLNKADLVPKDNLRSWLEYLRMEYPAIVFKASTQSQAKKLSHVKAKFMKKEEVLQTSNCIGADTLMQLLKNYCRNKGIKTAITVGVVGLPNVGKSSLINSLKRSKACNVGAVPGVTKNLQRVSLDSKISLLDCPGIVLPGGETTDASSSLRNVIKVESLQDPITPVEAILQRAGKEQMMLHYCVPDFKDTQEFLSLLGKRTGRLVKGGGVNTNAAAILVLNDWNGGKIKYFTRPPLIEKKPTVSELSKEFDLFTLSESDEKVLNSLPTVTEATGALCVDSIGPLVQVSEMEVEDEEPTGKLLQNIEVQMNEMEQTPTVEALVKKQRWETEQPEIDFSQVSLKKLQKKGQKKLRKEQNRNLKRADELVEAFSAFDGVKEKEDYNFNDYFSVT